MSIGTEEYTKETELAEAVENVSQENDSNNSIVNRLFDMARIDENVSQQTLELDRMSKAESLAELSSSNRLGAGLKLFLEMAMQSKDQQSNVKVDRMIIDKYIAIIDDEIGYQLDQVLHNKEFQKLESLWRGLDYLLSESETVEDAVIEILDVDKSTLIEDFQDSAKLTESGLHTHIYTREYDQPGGRPISCILTDFEFDNKSDDIYLAQQMARVGMMAHCPVISAISPKFFGTSLDSLVQGDFNQKIKTSADFIKWRSLRESEESRYLGLVFPRFLLRAPYGPGSGNVKGFNYDESVDVNSHDDYLWGSSVFAFGANMVRAFDETGWTVNIRGPESGGRVDSLPIHNFDRGFGTETKMPTEVLIPESLEVALSDAGIIPLSYYKNSDYACFFSANSLQMPNEYIGDDNATANSRINTRLPYVFLISRLAHYLKVLQRENIGASKNQQVLEDELNQWLKPLITSKINPSPEVISEHPLAKGEVHVSEIASNPGYFKVELSVVPHFQVEGLDITLSLVSQLPRDLSS